MEILIFGYLPFLVFLLIVGVREEMPALIWSGFIPVWNVVISLRLAYLMLEDYAMTKKRRD